MNRRARDPDVEIGVRVVRATENALLVEHDGPGDSQVWIPRSMINDWSPDTDNDREITSIFLTESYATEKGLV